MKLLLWNKLFSFSNQGELFYKNTRIPYPEYMNSGYLIIRVGGAAQYKHKILYTLYTQKDIFPGDRVDHINGNKTDNSKSNLRNATASENNCNRRMRSDNTLGYKGIFFRKAKGGVYGWMIKLHGEAVSKSGFKTAEEAYLDRCKNLLKIHGEFANKG